VGGIQDPSVDFFERLFFLNNSFADAPIQTHPFTAPSTMPRFLGRARFKLPDQKSQNFQQKHLNKKLAKRRLINLNQLLLDHGCGHIVFCSLGGWKYTFRPFTVHNLTSLC
jgi:hypothetical protein